MSAYDICPPTERYHEESMVLRELSRKEDELYSQLDRSYDKTRRSEALTHRDKRNRINRVVQELSEEAKTQTTSRMFTLKRLQREKNHWFSHSKLNICQRIVKNNTNMLSRFICASSCYCCHRALLASEMSSFAYGC